MAAGGSRLDAALERRGSKGRTRRGATAATDVTGFGLAGHLAEMARASQVGATLHIASLPALPGALELLAQGERSTFHAENERGRKRMRIARDAGGDPRLPLLFDPQTSGGLLFGVAAAEVADCLDRLHQAGAVEACVIGQVGDRAVDQARLQID